MSEGGAMSGKRARREGFPRWLAFAAEAALLSWALWVLQHFHRSLGFVDLLRHMVAGR